MHRFNQQGPEGLRDIHGGGVAARLSSEHLAELAAIIEAGPIASGTAWFAGGVSICNASSSSASASTFMSAMSGRS